jgi:DNA-binding beta-propeller fold protein YncE
MMKANRRLLAAGAGSWLTLAGCAGLPSPLEGSESLNLGISTGPESRIQRLRPRLPANSTSREPRAPDKDYLVFVASEGNDRISLVRYGPGGINVERVSKMGRNPTEPVGPHGIGVSPDGRYYYVSTAHGFPNGELWKFTTVGDSLKGHVTLGMFPATLQVSPDGLYAYVVNFNVYGEMKPSSVSIVYADGMTEIARLTTCTMPHGSRLDPQGTKHYSACMMDDALVEIDTRKLAVARHFILKKGAERGIAGAPPGTGRSLASLGTGREPGTGDHAGHGTEPPKPGDVSCSPTWAQPSADGSKVYVACNKSSDVVEIDANAWTMTRRFPMGPGVYNLATSHDGKLLVGTNKRGQSVSVVDLASGKEIALLPTKRKVASGVVISPDDRYAFVTVEGVGSEPGTVEVIDLKALRTVATVDVGQQAGGIDFWKTVPAATH